MDASKYPKLALPTHFSRSRFFGKGPLNNYEGVITTFDITGAGGFIACVRVMDGLGALEDGLLIES